MESAKAFQNLVRKFFFNWMRNVENRENFPIKMSHYQCQIKEKKWALKYENYKLRNPFGFLSIAEFLEMPLIANEMNDLLDSKKFTYIRG